jgi:hypothetical protein
MQRSSYLLLLLLALYAKYERSLHSCCSVAELHAYELNYARLASSACNSDYALFSKLIDCHEFRLQLEPAYRNAARMQCWLDNHFLVKHYRTGLALALLLGVWLLRRNKQKV